MGYTAKSVVFDIADNWGDLNLLGIRSVDFWSGGSKIALTSADFTAYATYEYSSSYVAENVFDTTLSKTGVNTDTSWITSSSHPSSIRIIVVFDSAQTFDEIRVNNCHGRSVEGGTETDRGAKNVVINTSSDSITDTTYNATISNSTAIFDDQFDEHTASDVEDEQELTLLEVGIIFNSADKATNIVLSNSDQTATVNNSTWGSFRGTESKSTGKWYFEYEITNGTYIMLGVGTSAPNLTGYMGYYPGAWADYTGYLYHDSETGTAYGDAYTVDDVVGIAVDIDAGKIWWSINNVWQASGDPAAGTNPGFSNVTGTIFPMASLHATNNSITIRGTANCDYTPPTGFSFWDREEVEIECTLAEIDVESYTATIGGAVACTLGEISISAFPALFNNVHWSPDAADSTQTVCGENTSIFLSNDNQTADYLCGTYAGIRANKSHSSGKWYFEVAVENEWSAGYLDVVHAVIGIVESDAIMTGWAIPGVGTESWGFNLADGSGLWDGVYNSPAGWYEYGNPVLDGDIVGCAVDLDNNKIWWSINGVWQASGNPTTGLNPALSNVDIADAVPAVHIAYQFCSLTLRTYADNVYDPPELFYYWDYEAPLNETMIICTLPRVLLMSPRATIETTAVTIIACALATITAETYLATVGAADIILCSTAPITLTSYPATIEAVDIINCALATITLSTSLARVENVKTAIGTGVVKIKYYLTLTGGLDGTTDIEIPISSFQTRMRSGSPTYLSAVVPDTSYSAAISARPNGDLEIDMEVIDGAISQRETIVSVNLEDINPDGGGYNESITLTGHKQTTNTPVSIALSGSTYRSIRNGLIRHRVARYEFGFKAGDTVTISDDTFVADLVSISVSGRNTTVELAEQ